MVLHVGRPAARRSFYVAFALLQGVACAGDRGPDRPDLSARPGPPVTLEVRRGVASPFDRIVPLPADPLGLAAGDGELLMGNREDPWGFVRLRPAGEGAFEARKIALVDSWYQQPVDFTSVTWNGSTWVALGGGAWMGEPDTDFLLTLDADDLHLLDAVPAPPLLGCLAWDGTGYWAATRRNTAASPDSAWVYRLDPAFRVLARSPAPAVGCQGMTFDGDYLWMADIFTDLLYALEVWGAEPRLVRTVDPGLAYLSGVAVFEGSLWVVEYGDDRLVRLTEGVRRGAPAPGPR